VNGNGLFRFSARWLFPHAGIFFLPVDPKIIVPSFNLSICMKWNPFCSWLMIIFVSKTFQNSALMAFILPAILPQIPNSFAIPALGLVQLRLCGGFVLPHIDPLLNAAPHESLIHYIK